MAAPSSASTVTLILGPNSLGCVTPRNQAPAFQSCPMPLKTDFSAVNFAVSFALETLTANPPNKVLAG